MTTEWTDDYGVVYEINYVVTQHPDEGPEFYEWREKPVSPEHKGGWQVLPPFADVPAEVSEHFHGPVIGDEVYDLHAGDVLPGESEGVILTITSTGAICLSPMGQLFTDELIAYEAVINKNPDEIQPGDVIRSQHPNWIMGPGPLRDLLYQG